jgi:hypothetical protein
VQFRSLRNLRDPTFLGPRVGDKLIVSLLMFTLYFGIGDDQTPSQVNNQAGALRGCDPLQDALFVSRRRPCPHRFRSPHARGIISECKQSATAEMPCMCTCMHTRMMPCRHGLEWLEAAAAPPARIAPCHSCLIDCPA